MECADFDAVVDPMAWNACCPELRPRDHLMLDGREFPDDGVRGRSAAESRAGGGGGGRMVGAWVGCEIAMGAAVAVGRGVGVGRAGAIGDRIGGVVGDRFVVK